MIRIIAWFCLCLLMPMTWANDLQLTQLRLVDAEHLELSISWANSWRFDATTAPANHDAIWVFGKYQDQAGIWHHLDLSDRSQDFSLQGTELEAVAVSDGKGVWIRRSQNASGDISPTTLRIKLKQALPNGIYNLDLMGIEMVYIPEGSFWLGDSTGINAFQHGNSASPFWVDTEGVISASDLNSSADLPPAYDLPAAYPKGFAAFYVMKYELSQEQYLDFLNHLSYSQQNSRTASKPDRPAGTLALATSFDPSRNGIVIDQPGQNSQKPARYAADASDDGQYDQTDDGQNRACNYLVWEDLAAYLDWAALRPLTELEFEKACRGPEPWQAGQFAWGTPYVVDANTVVDDGTEWESVTETANDSAGLASHGYIFDGLNGALRNGFGGSAESDRLQAGASYFGVWELSGNVWELVVNVDSVGLQFTGESGDGMLDASGAANEATWPLNGMGAGHRGGAFNSGILPQYRDLAISDRFYISLYPSTRRSTTGGRGARKAP